MIRSTLNNNSQCIEHINVFSLIFQQPASLYYVSLAAAAVGRIESNLQTPEQ